MKKSILLLLCLSLFFGVFAQQKKIDFVVDHRLYDMMTAQEIEQMRQNDPMKLALLNIEVSFYCVYSEKMITENYNLKGDVCAYIKPGKKCYVNDIIENGGINCFDYNLPQDAVKYNVFRVGDTGNYIFVMPKDKYEAHKAFLLEHYGF